MARNDIRNNAIIRFLSDIATHPAWSISPSSIVASSGTTTNVEIVTVDSIHTQIPPKVRERTSELV